MTNRRTDMCISPDPADESVHMVHKLCREISDSRRDKERNEYIQKKKRERICFAKERKDPERSDE